MTLPTVQLHYTCGTCGVKDRPVGVVERRKNEDVVHWMQVNVTSAIAVDHRRTSPYCEATVMQHIKIPMPENGQPLGGAR